MIPLRIERVLPGSGRSRSVMTSVLTPHTSASVRLQSVSFIASHNVDSPVSEEH
jgi:hypothetical protein